MIFEGDIMKKLPNQKTVITCEKLALKWLSLLLFCTLFTIFVFCIFDEIIIRVVWILIEVLDIFLSAKLSGYGFSVFRSFIFVKIDEKGISNLYCNIRWEEIEKISYEHLLTRGRKVIESRRANRIKGDFGSVMLITKEQSEKENSFKTYSLKKTICICCNAQIKQFVNQYRPDLLNSTEE